MTNAAVAAIQYALEPTTDEGMAFLDAWNQGDFDVCRSAWPDAPKTCYIGADPLLPETMEFMEAERNHREQALLWCKFLKVADFSPAEDFKRNFWRGVVNLPADGYATLADAVQDAVDNDWPLRTGT
ncbi:hypothetical protein GWQ43_19990 (plasmid) [Alcaligenes faecalis]|uniref:hypothetical protein n=1 Tax=Alcaligenes faecalis TaxID=511 RepID=UPI000F677342|nr:hypothetical protein [Alcaligenes faecalis]QHS38451.1 hypothetical protein GWQ43_19990 [Alcaligenes faecalis]RSE57639.1 hypothetical protein EGT81_19580 [Alcaligenes faecalis]